MKKLILLLTAGLLTTSVVEAQQSTSIMHSIQNLPFSSGLDIKHVNGTPAPRASTHQTANKNTNGASGAWFSFQVANELTSDGGNLFFVTPDTNLFVPPSSNGGNFFWYCLGLGSAFDPASKFFSSNWSNLNTSAPDFVVTSGNAYTIDSIEVAGLEQRHFTNDIDTLYVDLVVGTDVTYNQSDITSGGQPVDFVSEGISVDTVYHVPEALYDFYSNSIISSGVIRITKILDPASAADTNVNGLNDWYLALPSPLHVPAGKHVVAYTHIGTQTRPALGTDIDSANLWKPLTYNLNQPQASGDYNTGLISLSSGWQLSSTQYGFYPGYFEKPSGTFGFLRDPFYSFHVICPTCNEVGVKNVTNTISKVNAYPTPAASEFYVPFTLSQNANVTVTFANAIGQTISTQNLGNVKEGKATFNVSKLANGVYFYTLEANGQRYTGRTVVAH